MTMRARAALPTRAPSPTVRHVGARGSMGVGVAHDPGGSRTATYGLKSVALPTELPGLPAGRALESNSVPVLQKAAPRETCARTVSCGAPRGLGIRSLLGARPHRDVPA